MCNAYSLVPKAHVGTLADLPRALVASRFQNAQRIERAIENSLQAEDPFVALNNRVSQSIPHMHIHLVLRHNKDGLKSLFWPCKPYEDQETMLRVQTIHRSA
jgi:histidine triad (HIT) family protein